jgi:Ni2+-binding GTPase involved in maturation of urease and hydrogenase
MSNLSCLVAFSVQAASIDRFVADGKGLSEIRYKNPEFCDITPPNGGLRLIMRPERAWAALSSAVGRQIKYEIKYEIPKSQYKSLLTVAGKLLFFMTGCIVPTVVVTMKGELMRIIVLSGFLGSGKTSLLLQLAPYLSRTQVSGRTAKVAIIENEVGAVGVDGKALAGSGLEVREMLSGCICCSLQDNLAFSITEMRELYAPDYLVIEATGLASGSQVAKGIRATVDGVRDIESVVVVDASRFMELLGKTGMMVERQLEGADTLVLNKTDIVSKSELAEVTAAVVGISPDARLVSLAASGQLSDDLLRAIINGSTDGDDNA